MVKKVAIACDRAGIDMKKFIINEFRESSDIVLHDLGTDSNDPVDYPDYAKKVVDKILINEDNFGILICGTGIGMSMAANKFIKIRAALCHNSLEARLAREHNDANIICLGARIIGLECAYENVKVFLNTSFSKEDRHIRRINKIDKFL